MPSPPSYGCCTRVNFVLKKHLLFQMNLSNSGLKNRSIKEYWLIFTVLKFPLGLQFSHNLTKFKIIKYISTIYIMTTTCTYLKQLTQVSDVAHGPLVLYLFIMHCSTGTRKENCGAICHFFLNKSQIAPQFCQLYNNKYPQHHTTKDDDGLTTLRNDLLISLYYLETAENS